jgi:serine phosphatase RsbU (regulator of sigma subunit)
MTLVIGIAYGDGTVEIRNAGHCLLVVINGEKLTTVNSSSLPIGLFCNMEYSFRKIKLNP